MNGLPDTSGSSTGAGGRSVVNRFWVAPAVLLLLGWAMFLGHLADGSPFRFEFLEGIGRNETRFRWETPLESLRVRLLGTVEVNDDETGFRSLSPGSRVEILHRDGLHSRRLTVEPAADGTLLHEFTDGGKKAPFDDGARAWLADLLPRIVSETGLGAEERVARLLARDGPEGVLSVIAGVQRGAAVVKYCEELLAQARPAGAMLERVIDRCDRGIRSSGDKTGFLVSNRARFLGDDRAFDRFFDAVDGIPSSGDHARALLAILGDRPLAADRSVRLVASARHVASSADRARVLIAAAGPLPDPARDEWFAVAETVPSSGDRTRVLLAFLDRSAPGRDSLLRVIDAATRIPSSGDMTRLFLRLADLVRGDPELRDAYLGATDSIPSRGDRDRARSAVLRGI